TLKTSSGTWSPVLAMAKPPHLERRFVAMLNSSLDRRPLSVHTLLAVWLVALAVTTALGAVRMHEEGTPAAASAPAGAVAAAVSVAKVAEPVARRSAAKRSAPKLRPAQPVQGLADGSLAGTVSDSSGAVIPGVTLTVSSRTFNPTGV